MADKSLTLSTQLTLDAKWESLCDEIKATVDVCRRQIFQLHHEQQIDLVNRIEQIHEITRIVVSSITI